MSRWRLPKLIALIGALGVSMIFLTNITLMIRNQRATARQAACLNNLRIIGIGLEEFGEAHGMYPNPTTIPAVVKASGTRLTLEGDSSNAIFRQLMVTGMVKQEWVFSTLSAGRARSDNVFDTDATMLAPGECAFAYLPGFDPTSDPGTPLAFGPLVPGSRNVDSQVFKAKYLVLKRDGSVAAHPVNKAGALRCGGMDLLDPRQPFWKGRAPDVRWPK